MTVIRLTEALRQEYESLFDSCGIDPKRQKVAQILVNKLISKQSRYQAVAASLGIPWYFIAVIHNMESSQNFSRHLHNGDPLTARTRQVPKGRPKKGAPPFTWEESASDALRLKSLHKTDDWSLASIMYQLERFNGWGYRKYHPHVKSPYLWSFSNHYKSGKYVADGRWSETARSSQFGASVLLRRMVEMGVIAFSDRPIPEAGQVPLISKYRTKKSTSAPKQRRAVELQQWLNSFPVIFLKEDGVPGRKTSDAFKLVVGSYLPDDTSSK